MCLNELGTPSTSLSSLYLKHTKRCVHSAHDGKSSVNTHNALYNETAGSLELKSGCYCRV